MYLYIDVNFFFISANPIGIGVIYVLAPNIVNTTDQIPKLVNDWLKVNFMFNSLSIDSSCGCVPY